MFGTGNLEKYRVKIVSSQYKGKLESYGIILKEHKAINTYEMIIEDHKLNELSSKIWVISMTELEK